MSNSVALGGGSLKDNRGRISNASPPELERERSSSNPSGDGKIPPSPPSKKYSISVSSKASDGRDRELSVSQNDPESARAKEQALREALAKIPGPPIYLQRKKMLELKGQEGAVIWRKNDAYYWCLQGTSLYYFRDKKIVINRGSPKGAYDLRGAVVRAHAGKAQRSSMSISTGNGSPSAKDSRSSISSNGPALNQTPATPGSLPPVHPTNARLARGSQSQVLLSSPLKPKTSVSSSSTTAALALAGASPRSTSGSVSGSGAPATAPAPIPQQSPASRKSFLDNRDNEELDYFGMGITPQDPSRSPSPSPDIPSSLSVNPSLSRSNSLSSRSRSGSAFDEHQPPLARSASFEPSSPMAVALAGSPAGTIGVSSSLLGDNSVGLYVNPGMDVSGMGSTPSPTASLPFGRLTEGFKFTVDFKKERDVEFWVDTEKDREEWIQLLMLVSSGLLVVGSHESIDKRIHEEREAKRKAVVEARVEQAKTDQQKKIEARRKWREDRIRHGSTVDGENIKQLSAEGSYLSKRETGMLSSSWERYYFLIVENELHQFRDAKLVMRRASPIESFPIADVVVEDVLENEFNKPCVFRIKLPGGGKSWVLAADGEREKGYWMKILRPKPKYSTVYERTEDELDEILESMKKNVEVADRRDLMRTYRRCFVGSDAVKYLVDSAIARDAEEAEAIGLQLQNAGFLEHVNKEYNFSNKNYYYVFQEDWKSFLDQDPTEALAASSPPRNSVWSRATASPKQSRTSVSKNVGSASLGARPRDGSAAADESRERSLSSGRTKLATGSVLYPDSPADLGATPVGSPSPSPSSRNRSISPSPMRAMSPSAAMRSISPAASPAPSSRVRAGRSGAVSPRSEAAYAGIPPAKSPAGSVGHKPRTRLAMEQVAITASITSTGAPLSPRTKGKVAEMLTSSAPAELQLIIQQLARDPALLSKTAASAAALAAATPNAKITASAATPSLTSSLSTASVPPVASPPSSPAKLRSPRTPLMILIPSEEKAEAEKPEPRSPLSPYWPQTFSPVVASSVLGASPSPSQAVRAHSASAAAATPPPVPQFGFQAPGQPHLPTIMDSPTPAPPLSGVPSPSAAVQARPAPTVTVAASSHHDAARKHIRSPAQAFFPAANTILRPVSPTSPIGSGFGRKVHAQSSPNPPAVSLLSLALAAANTPTADSADDIPPPPPEEEPGSPTSPLGRESVVTWHNHDMPRESKVTFHSAEVVPGQESGPAQPGEEGIVWE